MKAIEYQATYAGEGWDGWQETIIVLARDINSGFAKALKRANEPLGNGTRRIIHSIEFSRLS